MMLFFIADLDDDIEIDHRVQKRKFSLFKIPYFLESGRQLHGFKSLSPSYVRSY